MKDSTKETLGSVGGLMVAGAAVMAGAMLVKGAVKGICHVAGAISDKRAAKKAKVQTPAKAEEQVKDQIPTEIKESTGSAEP